MSKTYKSEALAAVHEMMEGFYESGAIDKQTMREFDEGCLTTVEPLTPEEIAEHVRQSIPAGRFGEPAEFGAAGLF